MYYLFEKGTYARFLIISFFIECLFSFIAFSINFDTFLTQIISLSLLLLALCIFYFVSKSLIKNKNKIAPTKAIFKPVTTKYFRFSRKLYICTTVLSFLSLFLSFLFNSLTNALYITINILVILVIIYLFVSNEFKENYPDTDDTILFTKDFLYYYMRVDKNSKKNQFKNSYIIPYNAIVRSYINKNNLYLEIDKNHPDFKEYRKFATHSKRIVISFNDYPELKQFVLRKDISTLISLKDTKNLTLSDYV